MYDQKILDELEAQLELSRLLYEGLLGWAKVIEVSPQGESVYFPTTLERLNQIIKLIADFPDRLQDSIKKIEEIEANEREIILDILKQHYADLITLRDQVIELEAIGTQVIKDEEGIYLSKTAQKMYEMAASMNHTFASLEAALRKMQGVEKL